MCPSLISNSSLIARHGVRTYTLLIKAGIFCSKVIIFSAVSNNNFNFLDKKGNNLKFHAFPLTATINFRPPTLHLLIE